MADVRSLLRNERASRRIVHPNATYSTTGTLVCLVCHIQLKAESLWDKHLRSAQHAMRMQRIRDGTLGRPPGAPKPIEPPPANGTSKKRKADDEDEPAKKRKVKAADGVPDGFFEEGFSEDEESVCETVNAPDEPPASIAQPTITSSNTTPTTTIDSSTTGTLPSHFFDAPSTSSNPSAPPIDENEWAAFERDMATPPPPASALTAAATISAAPLTAAEIAAQAREQASTQDREKMEAVIEGEKEDAARRLEEEFDDMAELEDRVLKLRAKREMLRRSRAAATATEGEGGGVGDGDLEDEISEKGNEADDDHDDDTSSGDDDSWNDWGR